MYSSQKKYPEGNILYSRLSPKCYLNFSHNWNLKPYLRPGHSTEVKRCLLGVVHVWVPV